MMNSRLWQKLRRYHRKGEEQKLANLTEQDDDAHAYYYYATRITKHDSRKERRQKLKHSFERNNVVMTVRKDDILMEKDDEEPDEADLYQGCLILPRSGANTTTTVPNCCIICLDEYKSGDVVVWSHNATECHHAFHRACVVKYFCKMQKKLEGTPCPCCRSDFTDLEVEKRQRKRNTNRRRTIRTSTSRLTLASLWRSLRY